MFRRLLAALYRPALPCFICGRYPSIMGAQVATEYRVFCFEDYRRHILKIPSVMETRR